MKNMVAPQLGQACGQEGGRRVSHNRVNRIQTQHASVEIGFASPAYPYDGRRFSIIMGGMITINLAKNVASPNELSIAAY